MELYTAGPGNGQRAAIAVNECGVPCKIHVLNLGQGDQKAADYLKINPTGRIPTLIDPEGPGGKPLTVTQSWAILMYLCEKTGKFLPADPVARVRVFQWMAEGAADYASVNQTIFFLGARMPEKVPDSAIKFYEDRFVNLWRFAEEQLAKYSEELRKKNAQLEEDLETARELQNALLPQQVSRGLWISVKW